MNISSQKIKTFQDKVLQFYEEEGRDLPWRKTTDRYHILVSEIMLQQTQVNRVVEKYNNWIEQFPTAQSLAQAKLVDVLQAWSGLGYNSRGKRLWEAAQHIVEQHEGKVPDNHETLITLPGVGPYTARSTLIFADNQNIATVDTNIRRIFIHEFKLPETVSDKQLFELAENLLPQGKSRDWHNALMDFGSTILTARKTGIKSKTQQSKFKGSKREIRSTIIKELLKRKLTKRKLKEHIGATEHNVDEILTELENEGMVQKEKQTYIIR